MKRTGLLPRVMFVLLIGFCMIKCSKNQSPLNIDFTNKNLGVVQSYTVGKWKLQYIDGGFAAIRRPAIHNEYMELSKTKWTTGDDSLGVRINENIVWKLAAWGASSVPVFSNASQGQWSVYRVARIVNDTLIMNDFDVSDAFYYHYTRLR